MEVWKMAYKIVDTFNGWEDDRRYSNEETAEKDCEKFRREFHRNPSNTGCYCNYAVIPADHDWYHHPSRGWIWG